MPNRKKLPEPDLELSRRLGTAIKNAKTNAPKLFKETGVAVGTLHGWVQGYADPGAMALSKVLKALGSHALPVLKFLAPEGAIHSPKPLSEVEFPKAEREESRVPVIEWAIAAGNPRDIDERDIDFFALIPRNFLKRGHAHIGLKVQGNSMEPVIRTGFIVFVDTSDRMPQRGTVVAFLDDGKNTIRRITEYKSGNRLVLAPDNPDGGANRTFTVDLKKEKNPIVGRVVFWWGIQP